MSWRVRFNEHFPGGKTNIALGGGVTIRNIGDGGISENPPEVYTDVAPAIGAERFTEFPFVAGTLTITRSSDGHEYVEGVDFEENASDSWTNLAITPGTGIVVHYFIDSSLEVPGEVDLSGYVTDPELEEAIEAHEAASNPHPAYLTEAEANALYKAIGYIPSWTEITGKPLTFPPAAHNHNDLYFTETESDGRYVRTVNGVGPDGSGNVEVEGGGGTAEGGRYTFTQSTPAATWTINHNLGVVPDVNVLDTSNTLIEPTVTHPSVNQTVISFSVAMSGTAYLDWGGAAESGGGSGGGGLPRECVFEGETVTIAVCEQMPVYGQVRIEGNLILEGSLIVRE